MLPLTGTLRRRNTNFSTIRNRNYVLVGTKGRHFRQARKQKHQPNGPNDQENNYISNNSTKFIISNGCYRVRYDVLPIQFTIGEGSSLTIWRNQKLIIHNYKNTSIKSERLILCSPYFLTLNFHQRPYRLRTELRDRIHRWKPITKSLKSSYQPAQDCAHSED